MKNVKKLLKGIDLVLVNKTIISLFVIIMGTLVMIFKSFGLVDLNLYISILFYVYSFVTFVLYFVKRKKDDYELLFLSLINILVATFIYVFRGFEVQVILGSSMLIYTILILSNRIFIILKMKNNSDFCWILRTIITFLLSFLGLLTTINLYCKTTLPNLMYSFYFIMSGLLMLIENVIEIFVTEDKFKKILMILSDETNNLDDVSTINENDIKIVPIIKKKEKKSIKSIEKKDIIKKESKIKTNVDGPKKKAGRPKKVEVKEEKIITKKKVGRPKKVTK